ncbi:MAG: GGDEF domain-containing protein [Croceibacterium sp.]
MGYSNQREFQPAGPSAGRIRRLFGLGIEDTTAPDPRQGLLNQIGDFLVTHDLAPSAENLLRAHAVFAGSNPRFARKVAELEDLGEPITQQWLDEIDRPPEPEHDSAEQLHKLAGELEKSIEQFSQTTTSAKTAASSYTTELAQHVATVGQMQPHSEVLASLAHIARAMLERTREVEEEMRRSEREATQLRRSLAKARREAGVDHLTGLPNRRAFEAVFLQERAQALEALEPLCLALVDIDFFKRVNDTHGHETGDRIIRAVGQSLSRISDRCHVARHGGEEFVLLFRGLTQGQVYEQLNYARERMAARRFVDRISNKPIGEVTISAGLIDVFLHGDMGHALRAADEALYKAKQAGRNRVELG